MRIMREHLATLLAILMVSPNMAYGANHREAPITALDRSADITDWYAFVSYDDPTKVTFILNVDPLLDPSNGPNYFPFDPDIVYSIRSTTTRTRYPISDSNSFSNRSSCAGGLHRLHWSGKWNQFTRQRAPKLSGAVPSQLIPPAITALDGKGPKASICARLTPCGGPRLRR